MSRIRSIHPGQWTDEQFVLCSMAARLLALGLRNEADDQGVFEWKPLTLKMRLFPADDVKIGELLDELIEQNLICRFDVDGKAFGAIRNFCKYQRPKSPSDVHPLPDEYRIYVALETRKAQAKGKKPGTASETSADDAGGDAEPLPERFGTTSEIDPQRKEEGGRREEEKEEKGGADAPEELAFQGRVIRLAWDDYRKWRQSYQRLTDASLRAELEAADAYYLDNPPPNGKWFFPVSSWLKRANEAAGKARIGL
jgi:hypothetical protein